MKSCVCKDKPLGCGTCEKHVCLDEVCGNSVGLRVAQMAIMQGMTEHTGKPEIIAGLDIALSKVTERILDKEGNSVQLSKQLE